MNGGAALRISDLPRSWKERPQLTESRSYLLGWLAGYFSADGHVSNRGQAVIYSAKKLDIAYVKDVCLTIGVRISSGSDKVRAGFPYDKRRKLYFASINIRDVPNAFWILPHHRKRAIKACKRKPFETPDWIVASTEMTARREEVFCAVVPGRRMFTLADGLITGNCPFSKKIDFQVQAEVYPDEFARTVALERNNRRFSDPESPIYLKSETKPVDQWIAAPDVNRRRVCVWCKEEIDLALHTFGDTPLYARYKEMATQKAAAR